MTANDPLWEMICTEARDVPVVCAMGGGYSPEIWNIVEAHCHTFRLAAEFWG